MKYVTGPAKTEHVGTNYTPSLISVLEYNISILQFVLESHLAGTYVPKIIA